MVGPRLYLSIVGVFAAILVLAACAHIGDGGSFPFLPKLRAGASLPAANVRLTGTLIHDGNFLRVAGTGNTVIIWPIAGGSARTLSGYGNVVVIWPYTAALENRADGGGTTVVVWPRGVGAGSPVRVGDRVELAGIVLVDDLPARAAADLSDIVVVTDNIAGRLTDCPRARGCAGAAFIVSDIRPAPAGGY